ncbi:MAG TPA: glutathione S-transferase, partial [Hyphomicrobiaceae bacterium]|nr:glutathione S-transferase [Hyphomicrobiaceae bacterium]
GLAPPPGSRSRADYYRWLFFAAGPLEAAVADKVLGAAVPAEKQGMIGYGNFDLVVATLDQALAGKTALVDGRFSAADVYVGSHLMWGKQFGTLPKRPSFESYCAGLAGRPASTRASAIDDALVPNHPMPSR